jgi:ketosteroid isomerase-like protein
MGTCSIGSSAGPDPGETAIRALEDSFVAAVNAKDIDKIMACYEHSKDLVVFDVVPPRQYTGWKAYKKDFSDFLAGCKDTPKVEMTDLVINAGTNWGFGHNIQRFTCTQTNGKPLDLTLRVTDGYRNFKGKWLIAHEHVSVPVDLATGKADLSSKP